MRSQEVEIRCEKRHKCYDTAIEIIDNTTKSENQELVEDLIQIVTVFSARLLGRRANKAKKLIKELSSDDSVEKDSH